MSNRFPTQLPRPTRRLSEQLALFLNGQPGSLSKAGRDRGGTGSCDGANAAGAIGNGRNHPAGQEKEKVRYPLTRSRAFLSASLACAAYLFASSMRAAISLMPAFLASSIHRL